MKKNLMIFGIVMVASLSILATRPLAAIWQVPGDFATIQEAIDSSNVGDTILVGPGYHEGAIVRKAVEIKGQGGAVINRGPLLVTVPCGGELDIGFRFGFSDDPTGSGATISQLKFENVSFPVFSRGADNVTVTQCIMLSPIQGVTSWNGNGWEISHNEIIDLQTANGGGIGIVIGVNSGAEIIDNVISHNKISGTLYVPECDQGGYDGSGIVLYADWRYGKDGGYIKYNRVVKNKISLTTDNLLGMNVHAIELTEAENPTPLIQVVLENAIGFNDLRGTVSQIVLTPDGLDIENDISRNLGENRGHGLHPSVFGPGGN